jgi:hypothetical protein
MINSQIYDILKPIKYQTIQKIQENLKTDSNKLNIVKAAVPELNVFCTFEKTFTTLLGYALQQIASECGKDVVNTDKTGKQLGIDLSTSFGEGQLKSNKNTQTGTHKKDSIQKLLKTTKENQSYPFFATAFGESYEYVKNDILYIGGKAFWSKIDINYDDLYDTVVYILKEIYDEIKSTIIPTL